MGSKTGGNVVAGLCGIFAFIWTAIICVPGGWDSTSVCHSMRLETCLYHVRLRKLTLGYNVTDSSDTRCEISEVQHRESLWKLPERTYSFGEMQDFLCASRNRYCTYWQQLYHGSMIFFFIGWIIVILHCLSGGFVVYFFYTKGTESGLKGARVCLTLIPGFAILGFFLYFLLSKGFGDSDAALNYGPCFFVSLLLVLASPVPTIVFHSSVLNRAAAIAQQHTDMKDERRSQFIRESTYAHQPSAGGYGYGQQGAGGYGHQASGGYGHQASGPYNPSVQMSSYPGGHPQQAYPPQGGYPQQGGYQQSPGAYRY